jgi:hypothetical protein
MFDFSDLWITDIHWVILQVSFVDASSVSPTGLPCPNSQFKHGLNANFNDIRQTHHCTHDQPELRPDVQSAPKKLRPLKKLPKKKPADFFPDFCSMCCPCPFAQLDGISACFDNILPSKIAI